jgi:hypothetical protein
MSEQANPTRATSPYLMRRTRSLQEVLIQHKRPVAAVVVAEPAEPRDQPKLARSADGN